MKRGDSFTYAFLIYPINKKVTRILERDNHNKKESFVAAVTPKTFPLCSARERFPSKFKSRGLAAITAPLAVRACVTMSLAARVIPVRMNMSFSFSFSRMKRRIVNLVIQQTPVSMLRPARSRRRAADAGRHRATTRVSAGAAARRASARSGRPAPRQRDRLHVYRDVR